LVLSTDRRVAEESSPPPQQDMETSPPIASPRAPSPKRARIEAGDGHAIVAGGPSTSILEDVSFPVSLDLLFCFDSLFLSSAEFFPL
jgi:hypothetical protein